LIRVYELDQAGKIFKRFPWFNTNTAWEKCLPLFRPGRYGRSSAMILVAVVWAHMSETERVTGALFSVSSMSNGRFSRKRKSIWQ
jgi:hypothetical protein